jgi:hypothetical protein
MAFVFLDQIFLAFAAIGEKQDHPWKKMAVHLLKQRFGLRAYLAYIVCYFKTIAPLVLRSRQSEEN